MNKQIDKNKCLSCGNENKLDAKFCSSCGQEITMFQEEKKDEKQHAKKDEMIGGIVIAIIILITLAFYWYEWRPSQIRKECADGDDYFYYWCIREKGLKE